MEKDIPHTVSNLNPVSMPSVGERASGVKLLRPVLAWLTSVPGCKR
jgi:hypothetical protein